MKARIVVPVALLAAACIAIYTQVTLFVIQPIGALPEGRTAVILRSARTHFIDSPDALCERIQGGVSLLCRGMAIRAVLEDATVLANLPYSAWLYGISTGGRRYDR